MPGSAIFNTSPGQPVSATTRLLPPPRTNRGRSRERANVAACCTSPIFLASTKYLAGPPILMVVSGASGMFSSRSTNHFQIYTWVEAGAPVRRLREYTSAQDFERAGTVARGYLSRLRQHNTTSTTPENLMFQH